MPFVEDFAPFLSAAEFATTGLLAGVEVRGVFDNGYEVFNVSSGVAASGPVYLLPSASVPAAPIGLALVLGADTWKVVEAQPDGTGMTILSLRKP